jgi:uncharacterized membrane protein
MWLFYALTAAVMWGVGQIFVKKGFQDTSPLFSTITSTLFGLMIFLPFSLINGVQFDHVLQIAPIALIIATLFLCFYYAINHGQISLTGTIVGTYPVVTVVLSLLFLNESPSVYQKLAIALAILGTALVASPSRIGKIRMGTWFWWAIFAVFAIGIADFLIKLLLNQYDIYTYLFTFGLCSATVNLILLLLDKKGRVLPKINARQNLPTLTGVAMMEVGFFVFHLALVDGYVSLVSPISGIYVAITALLAWIFLKEKIDKIHFVGIALAAIGVILVGIG